MDEMKETQLYISGTRMTDELPNVWSYHIKEPNKDILKDKGLCMGDKRHHPEWTALMQALLRFSHIENISIFTDNKQVFDIIRNRVLDSWANDGWITRKSHRLLNVRELKTIHFLLPKEHLITLTAPLSEMHMNEAIEFGTLYKETIDPNRLLREQAIDLFAKGYSTRRVAAYLKISKSSAHRMKQQLIENIIIS